MCNINKSLFVLGNVIHYLATKKKNKKFIPYKDSKLTQILEDSLSGNSSIYLIATISPNDENFDETINTLKFADRAHEVMTVVTPNQIINNDILGDGGKKEMFKLYKELSELKQLLLLREKRGNLNPLQSQFLKLKKENNLLKKYLGGGSNLNAFEKLIQENNNLKKEIKVLTSENLLLKNEKNIDIKDLKDIKDNNNIDFNNMNNEFKKKIFKSSLSDNNIFDNFKYNSLSNEKTNRNINSTTLMNTGSKIIDNKNNNSIYNLNGNSHTYDIQNKYIKEIKNENSLSNDIYENKLKLNGMNQIKRNYNIKSKYNINYNTINLEDLGIKKKFNKNKNIMESLKRLKILDDLSKNNNININHYSKNLLKFEKNNIV